MTVLQRAATTAAVFTYQPAQATRFLAARWKVHPASRHWHSMLLEPIIRFSDLGVECERMIDDTAIAICVAIEDGSLIRSEAAPATMATFQSRGWSLPELCAAAEIILRGEAPSAESEAMFPGLQVVERQLAFAADECDEVLFDYLDAECVPT